MHKSSAAAAGVMERAAEVSSSVTADGTAAKEATETCNTSTAETGKRKSDETDEPEKAGRGKRRRGGGGKKLRPGERYIPPPQKRNPGVSFSQEHFDETAYYFEGGLRKNNDHMRNTVHRHEPPVVGRPLEVLVDNGEVLVVDKPASIPVHPCGRFRHNTVIFILGKERGISELHTVHRLDRLTSGVLLFARTLEMSQKLDQLVRDRQLEKEYVCRVEGEFPESELICEEPILVVSFKVGLCRVHPKGKECRTVFQRLSFNGSTSVVRCLPLTGRTHQIRVHLQYLGFPILNDPIYRSSAWGPHRGKGGQVGKSDEELLQALVEEHRSKESLHMLDIPDDAVGLVQEEGNTEPWASGKEENTDKLDGTSKTDETVESFQTQKDMCGAHKKLGTQVQTECNPSSSSDTVKSEVKDINSNSNSLVDSQCPAPTKSNGNQTEAADSSQQIPPGTRDHLCSECKLVRPDPTEQELVMYLHALRYKGPDFEYSTQLPDWAKDDWVEVD
ncbi:pseudouridylate synthase RPUSD2 isoform X3 [Centroberyx affinis]|uniref:pseudouridylate synthase RPUSD2 isoform X3 n=1 Tax=Centroberyx affinis TaxID=166261 RepID=UPI003A5B974E